MYCIYVRTPIALLTVAEELKRSKGADKLARVGVSQNEFLLF